MTQRADSIESIKRLLAILRAEVELSNSLNMQNINIYAENFFRDFLNLLYNWNLENANFGDRNSSTIDLKDVSKKLAIQVTSDNSGAKVHSTLESFDKNKLYENFDELIILIITTKKEFPKTKFNKGELNFFSKEKNIIDLSDLLAKINDFKTEKILEVESFITKEVGLKIPNNRKKESNEVETIMTLITFLSQSNMIYDSLEIEPDPEYKIYYRFENYRDYLTGRFTELYSIYKLPLDSVENEIGLDKVKIKKIQLYLKRVSDEQLAIHQGNPKKAISELVNFFSLKLSNTDFNFDVNAVEFYIIDELIKCNVFPNP